MSVSAERSPLQVAIGFAHCLLHRDPSAAQAHLGLGARVLTADGTEVSGAAAVGEILTQLTSPGLDLEILPGRTIVNHEVALCTQSWRLTAAGSSPLYQRASKATLVLGLEDERWRILILSPWG